MEYNWNHFHNVLLLLNYRQVTPPLGEDGFLYYQNENRSRISIQKSNSYPKEYVEALLIRMEITHLIFSRLVRE